MPNKRRPSSSPKPLIELVIHGFAFGGDGVGHHSSGKVVFVPNTLPGDRVRARITREKRTFARAELHSIIEPSPERIPSACNHSERCGGCQLWNLPYERAWHWKSQAALDSLTRISKVPLPTPAYFPAPSPTHYRRRVRFQIDKHGHLGFFSARSRNLLPIQDCPVTHPALLRAALSIPQDVLALTFGGSLHLELDAASDPPQATALLTARTRTPKSLHAALRTLDLPSLGLRGVQTQGTKNHFKPVHFGQTHFRYRSFGHTLDLPIGVFTQSNDHINQTLIQHTLDLLQLDTLNNPSLLDLFSGWGNFSIPIASKTGATIHALELSELSIQTGQRHAQDLNLPILFQTHDLTQPLPSHIAKLHTLDAVILDPPRTGAAALLSQILHIAPSKILYISCDPTTLGRDLHTLTHASRYAVTHLAFFDMFPQTYHVETLALLELQ